MSKTRILASASTLALLLAAGRLDAQLAQTFASARTGSDANTCNVSFPCKTFAGALLKVAAGGEIIAVDSGDYGVVTINKGVRISAAPGVYAGVHASGVTAAIVVAAAASDSVSLSGLTITSTNTAGISFTSGGTLEIDRCVVDGASNGVNFADPGQLFVKDSTFRNCTLNAVLVAPSPGNATASIDRCRFEGNTSGVRAMDGVSAVLRDSVLSGQDGDAITTLAQTSGVKSSIDVVSCVVMGGFRGVVSSAQNGGIATARVSGSTVTANTIGLAQVGAGSLQSLGDNVVKGNTTDKSGTVTIVPGD